MTVTACLLCSFLESCDPKDREDIRALASRESADTLKLALDNWQGRHVVGTTTIKKHIREEHDW